jgi:hypothetical protein
VVHCHSLGCCFVVIPLVRWRCQYHAIPCSVASIVWWLLRTPKIPWWLFASTGPVLMIHQAVWSWSTFQLVCPLDRFLWAIPCWRDYRSSCKPASIHAIADRHATRCESGFQVCAYTWGFAGRSNVRLCEHHIKHHRYSMLTYGLCPPTVDCRQSIVHPLGCQSCKASLDGE